jgi:hypothetical protein
MASRTAKTMNEPEEAINRGTGNVFADLGYPDAEERETKEMPARVQDVQPTDCHGQRGYSFTVWDDSNGIALTVGFPTSDDAN